MYSVREASAVLGISVARLRSYLRSGLIVPSRSDGGQLRLTFQDLVFLRRTEGLVSERIPPRRIHLALRALAERLPEGTSVVDLRLVGEGENVVVDEGGMRWQAMSGQTLFDFAQTASEPAAPIVPLPPKKRGEEAPAPPTLSIQDTYARACVIEDSAPDEAKAMYRSVLERDPQFCEAHVNLGRMLHESGDVYAALVHYRAALSLRPHDATAAFNAGVALEDLGATADAIVAYRQAIENDGRNPDAHYNLARLLEQTGKPELAVRHLLLYRQLMKKP